MKLLGYIFQNNLRPDCPYDDFDIQVLSCYLIDSGCSEIFSGVVRRLFILYSS